MVNLNGNAFVTGSWSPYTAKTELYDFDQNNWEEKADYPFHSRIYAYAALSVRSAVFIFGGFDGSFVSTVAKYENNIWTLEGNLNQARKGHEAITVNGMAYIVGGYR